MSNEITTAMRIKYLDDWYDMAQQKKSRLRERVRQDPDFLDGKWGYYDRIGATESQIKTTRHGDTPIIETPHSRRRIWRATHEWGDMVDRSDVRRTLKNPTNKYVMNSRKAFNRDVDRAIVRAALGNSEAIDEDEGVTIVALPATQKIDVAYKFGGGGTASGLTKDKVIRAKMQLLTGEVDEDEDLTWVYHPDELEAMLQTMEVTSSDYASVKALVEGKIDTWMGFKWKRFNELPLVTTGVRANIAFAMSGIGLAADGDPFVGIGPRPDKKWNTGIYMEWEIGATRIEEVKVMEVACQIPT